MYILCSRRSCSLSLRHLVGNSIDQWKRFYPQDGTTRTSDFLLPPRGSDKDNDPANICLAHFPTQHTVPENLIWILSRNNVSFADCGPHRHLKTIGVLSVWNSLVLIQNKISKNFFIIFITKYLIHEKRLLPEKKKSYNPPRFTSGWGDELLGRMALWKWVCERVGLVDMESIAQTVSINLLCEERFCLKILTFDKIISLAITETSKRFAYFSQESHLLRKI